ncbi:MAG: hypothetical protein ACT4P7_13410 [Gemmatimonadaceae bacterium]
MASPHRSTGSDLDADTRLRELVLGYLDDHPTAMDTLDGIAEWWILRQQIEIEVRRVSAVLATLVHEGVLEECEQSGVRFFRRRGGSGPRVAVLSPQAVP